MVNLANAKRFTVTGTTVIKIRIDNTSDHTKSLMK